MKILVSLILGSLLATQPMLAEEPHHHDEAGQSKLQLNQGKKWETDAALRAGMAKIKSLVEKRIDAIHENKLSQSEYSQLSKEIQTEVSSIFKNCKLSPKADAQLHLILAEILGGASAMQTKDSPSERQKGAIQVIRALAQYPRFFDHPDWVPLKHE